MPSLRLGEAAGEFSDVPGADQLAHSGVTTWRHCPVIAGRLAAPDPPPRVSAPEPVKFGIQAPPAWPGVHGRGRPAVDAASAPPTSPGMTSPGSSERRDRNARSAMQQPPSSSNPAIPASPESGAPRVPAACCARSPSYPALATWAASRGGRSGAAARPAHKAGRVPACATAPGMTRSAPAQSRGSGPRGWAAPRGKKPLPGQRQTCRIRYNAPATTSAASVMWRPPAVTGRNAGSPSTRVRVDGTPQSPASRLSGPVRGHRHMCASGPAGALGRRPGSILTREKSSEKGLRWRD